MLKAATRRAILWWMLAAVVWFWVGIESSVIPAVGEICKESKYSEHEKCTTHHIALVLAWQGAKILDDISPALTAFATAILAVFTWRLWWSTENLWKEATKASGIARDTANAAKESAEALPKIERAYIFVDSIEGSYGAATTVRERGGVEVRTQDIHVTVAIRNHGRTPAVLLNVSAGVVLREDFLGIEQIEVVRLMPPGIVISAGDSREAPQKCFTVDFDGAKTVLAGTGDLMLILFGRVEYFDVLKRQQTMEFCRFYDRQTETFVISEYGSWT